MSDDHTLARSLATDAGALLLQLRAEAGPDADPRALRTAGDARSHELLAAALARHRPTDAVLSEEGRDDRRRLSADRVWIVDPLDGTREFGEAGRTDWAVHVALWERGALAAGAVALPGLGVTFGTDEPPALPPPVTGPIRLLVSRTRPPDFAVRLAELVESELVPLGSAGAKAMAVVRGQADAYAHAGGQYEWDSAAPVAVALAAGLHASRVDGTPLRYNAENVYQPDLLICRPELAEPLLAAIDRVVSS
ncbi:MAG: 3'(2'),5'-bisphosphate nucleotidase CysQ [Mycobacteriales bacterium]